jgi:hypothetical protein
MLEVVAIDDTGLFTERLQEWEGFHSSTDHMGGPRGQTPYERLRQKTRGPLYSFGLRQLHNRTRQGVPSCDFAVRGVVEHNGRPNDRERTDRTT